MVTGVFAVTVDVVTVKLAELAPAGTVTIGWGRATRLLVESVTVTPPAGAGPLRNTVPEIVLPPTTLAAASVTDDRRGGAFGSGPRLMNTVLETPPALAVICAVVPTATGLVVTVKLFALLPAAMETVDGTWTDGSLLTSDTAPPPAGAGMTVETVPLVDAPPIKPPLVRTTPNANGREGPGGRQRHSRLYAQVKP